MRFLVFLFLTLLFTFHSAHADTDYRCLTLCTNNGLPASVCLPQCRYNLTQANMQGNDISVGSLPQGKMPAPPTPDKIAEQVHAVSQHKLLDAPIPSTNTVVMPPASRAKETASAYSRQDYQCVSDCTKLGMKYEYCSQNCLVTDPRTTSAVRPWEQVTQSAAPAGQTPSYTH